MSWLGEFIADSLVTRLECSGLLGSAGPDSQAVTHGQAQDNFSLQITFRPEEGAQLLPEFDIIILKNYTTFWTDITV